MFDAFFAYAREREHIRILRERGAPSPWTNDPILAQYRFCNVNREHDRTTTWFRQNVRDPLRNDPEKVFLATLVFRWFNRIETGEVLHDMLLEGRWDEDEARRRLRVAYPKGPYFTGSYIVRSPFGMNKLDGILTKITEALARQNEFFNSYVPGMSLEQAWNILRSWSFLGDFTAYELVTDLRYTCLLCLAPDVMTWANPGPGATRGLSRIFEGTSKAYNQSQKKKLNEMMRVILKASIQHWPEDWFSWDMRTVEHTLCEFDKYERVRLGEGRPRQVFIARS